jgi:TonB-linked SusC/RagA family outer membrane protein
MKNVTQHSRTKGLFLLVFFSLISLCTYAQVVASGLVVDDQNEPVIGATVIVKGSPSIGTATDIDGKFQISVPNNSTLVFSSVGFVSVERKVATNMRIFLTSDTKELEDLIVVGYGTMKKSDLSGSVSQVKMNDFNNGANPSLNGLIQGKAAGVNIVQSSGEPGSGFSVNIRGANSIKAGVAPLYVIDGFPVDDSRGVGSGYITGFSASRTPRDPLASINTDDIESVEILKDASATAIYGARGSNGVILITTKKGKKGKGTLGYAGSIGIQTAARKLKLLNAQDYKTVLNQIIDEGGENEIYRIGEIANDGAGTDWQNEALRTAMTTNHAVTYSGSNDKTSYYSSLGYFKQDGIIKTTSYERYSARLNVNSKVTDWFEFSTNMTASYGKDNYAANGYDVNENAGVMYATYNYDPTKPVYDENGDYYQSSDLSIDNPIAIINGLHSNADNYRFLFSSSATFHILKGLDAKFNLGGDYLHEDRTSFASSVSKVGRNKQGIGAEQNGLRTSYLTEGMLYYKNKFGKNSIDAMGGLSFQRFRYRYSELRSATYPDESLGYNNLGLGNQSEYRLGNSLTGHKLMSYITRLNYVYDDRYLATVTFRADGSSRFGNNNKYGYFPSAAIAWRAINEDFVKEFKQLSNLKLRFSWGMTGNQDIGNFPSLTTYSIGSSAIWNNSKVNGIGPSKMPNPDLKWETTSQVNLGLDFGFFDNRISGYVDYFWKKTYDMLMDLPIDQTTGYSSVLSNIGSISNHGLEITLNTTNIETSKFTWTSGVQFSMFRNEVTDLGGRDQIIIGAGYNHVGEVAIQKVGVPLNSYYGWEVAGVWQENDDFSVMKDKWKPGEVKYVDQNNDGVINNQDRVVLGDANPDFSWSFSNEIKYDRLSLSILIDGMQGVQLLSGQLIDNYFPLSFRRNKLSELYLNRWTPTNPTNKYPSFDNPLAHGRYVSNSNTISDASYIRLKNITLSYTLPRFTKALSLVQVYASAENLCLFTKYLGLDPTLNSNASSRFRMDFNSYPSARVITFGAKVEF